MHMCRARSVEAQRALFFARCGQLFLGQRRGRCCQRIFGPGMSGIASPHFSAYCGVAVTPEMRQVARDLQGAAGRRIEPQQQGNAPSGDTRRVHTAEHFLQFYIQRRTAFFTICYGALCAGGRLPVRGGKPVQQTTAISQKKTVQGSRKCFG